VCSQPYSGLDREVEYGQEAGKLQAGTNDMGNSGCKRMPCRFVLSAECKCRSFSRGFVVLDLPRGRGISLGGFSEGTAVACQNEFDMEFPMGESWLMLSRLLEIPIGPKGGRIWFGISVISARVPNSPSRPVLGQD
jgi:hypothetical protein